MNGKIRLTFAIACPAEHVAEGDRIWASHLPWMAETHPREGEKGLVSYDVSKAPELSDAMDASSAPTGRTVYLLNEIYNSPAGVANHFELAENWSDFPALMEWMGNCDVTVVPAAEIFNSL